MVSIPNCNGELTMANANISDVAALAKVSVTTVSRVLNESASVSHKTRVKVQEAIETLNYKRSDLARGLRINETKTIGVIISNILNPFFTRMVRGIEDVSQNYNYNIVLCNTDEQPEKERKCLDMLLSKNVDGLIIAGTGGMNDYTRLENGFPTVFVDRRPDDKYKGRFDTVLVDNINGSAEAVEHLIDSGYKRIGVIAGSNESTTGYERFLGYKKALKKRGIPEDESLIKYGNFLGNMADQLTKELLEANCDSIFVTNNMIMLGVLEAVKKLGMRIPDDVGLVVFDDVEWMQYIQPSFTAVAQPTYQIGLTAMTVLMDRILNKNEEAPKEIVLPVSLIQRESSRKMNQSIV